jgi:hypothetical protein
MTYFRKFLLLLALVSLAGVASAQSVMLKAVTATGPGTAVTGKTPGFKTYQVSCATTSGSGSASVAVEGSNEVASPDASTNWDTIVTITLVCGVASKSDGQTSGDQYRWVRGNVKRLSGTGTNASLIMSYGG